LLFVSHRHSIWHYLSISGYRKIPSITVKITNSIFVIEFRSSHKCTTGDKGCFLFVEGTVHSHSHYRCSFIDEEDLLSTSQRHFVRRCSFVLTIYYSKQRSYRVLVDYSALSKVHVLSQLLNLILKVVHPCLLCTF